MTGYELLKSKMLQYGATKNMIENKTFNLMITVLAEITKTDDFDYIEAFHELTRRFEQAAKNADNEKARYENIVLYLESEHKTAKYRSDELKEWIGDLLQITNELLSVDDEIVNAETPEQRDRIKAAVYLKDNTTINTCYDNTAFIRALGSVLSGVKDTEQPKKCYKVEETPERYQSSMKDRLLSIQKRLNGIQENHIAWRKVNYVTDRH